MPTVDEELEEKERGLIEKEPDLLEILLKKETNWPLRMVSAQFAYHVTNIPKTVLKTD